MKSDRRTYLITSAPNWVLIAIVMWIAVARFDVLWWVGVLFLAAWLTKDLLLFPVMRRYYRSEPAERRMVGEQGVTLSPLAPRGFIRVHGEIWQAEQSGTPVRELPEGADVRVRDIRGLLLYVEPI